MYSKIISNQLYYIIPKEFNLILNETWKLGDSIPPKNKNCGAPLINTETFYILS